jgi:TRAP-type C4-dicarboxylate transport system substrate-binding protein
MKSKLSILMFAGLILVLLISTLASLIGCTSESTPATTYEFKFLDQYVPGTPAANQGELLGTMISDATKGRVTITYYHAESLGKVADFLNLLNGGVTDIVNITPGNFPDQFDIETYLEIPMLGINSREARSEVTWACYDKGYFTGLTNYKVMGFNPTPTFNLWLKKKITTVDELKGLKIRAADAPTRKLIELAGGTPVAMSGSQVYEALRTGLLDGTNTADEQALQSKFYEVLKYGVYQPKTNIGCVMLIMNKDAWNRLPKDLQKTVDKAIENYKTEFLSSVKPGDEEYATKLKENGMELYSLSSTEAAKLIAFGAPLKNDWLTARAAKGLPVNDMAKLVDSILAKYNK